jgi:hypothetical protein
MFLTLTVRQHFTQLEVAHPLSQTPSQLIIRTSAQIILWCFLQLLSQFFFLRPYTEWLDFILSHPNPPLTISTSYGDDEQTGKDSEIHPILNVYKFFLQFQSPSPFVLVTNLLSSVCIDPNSCMYVAAYDIHKVLEESPLCSLLGILVSAMVIQIPPLRSALPTMARMQRGSFPFSLQRTFHSP